MPVLQGVRLRVPRQRRHGHLQGRVPPPPLPPPHPAHGPLPDGLAAGARRGGPPHPPGAARGRLGHARPGRLQAHGARRRPGHHPPADPLRPRKPATVAATAGGRGVVKRRARDGGAVAGLLQQPARHRAGAGGGARARGARLQRHRPRRLRVLRADLALDRAADHGQEGPRAQRRGARALPGPGLDRRRRGALLHGHARARVHGTVGLAADRAAGAADPILRTDRRPAHP